MTIFTKNIGFLSHIRPGKRFFSFKLVVTSFTTNGFYSKVIIAITLTTILTISDNSNNTNNNFFDKQCEYYKERAKKAQKSATLIQRLYK
jgi:hypothetical protein